MRLPSGGAVGRAIGGRFGSCRSFGNRKGDRRPGGGAGGGRSGVRARSEKGVYSLSAGQVCGSGRDLRRDRRRASGRHKRIHGSDPRGVGELYAAGRGGGRSGDPHRKAGGAKRGFKRIRRGLCPLRAPQSGGGAPEEGRGSPACRRGRTAGARGARRAAVRDLRRGIEAVQGAGSAGGNSRRGHDNRREGFCGQRISHGCDDRGHSAGDRRVCL